MADPAERAQADGHGRVASMYGADGRSINWDAVWSRGEHAMRWAHSERVPGVTDDKAVRRYLLRQIERRSYYNDQREYFVVKIQLTPGLDPRLRPILRHLKTINRETKTCISEFYVLYNANDRVWEFGFHDTLRDMEFSLLFR